EQSQAQNNQIQDRDFLRERMRQTLTVEVPENVVADRDGRSIVLRRAGKGDRVAGIWIEGKGKPAIVVDPAGSAAALETDVVKRLRHDGKSVLLLDVFQTGMAKAPRAGDITIGSLPKLSDDADEEERADAAAGYPKFLTFNVSDDAVRVQDIVTAIAY